MRGTHRTGLLGAALVIAALSSCVSASLDIPESENPASVHAQAAPLPEVARALREDPVPLPSRSATHDHGAMHPGGGAVHEGHGESGAHEGHAMADAGAGR